MAGFKSGDIIRFKYQSKNHPNPIILVLNPSWKGLVHGLLLNILSEKQIVHLLSLAYPARASNIANNLPEVQEALKDAGHIADINEHREFYMKHVASAARRLNCYKTYRLEKMSRIQLDTVNYLRKFGGPDAIKDNLAKIKKQKIEDKKELEDSQKNSKNNKEEVVIESKKRVAKQRVKITKAKVIKPKKIIANRKK